jgi:peptidoglycan/LPS O-acetylase OafA/YrhL
MQEITDIRSPEPTPGVPRLPHLKALTSIRFFAAMQVALFHLVAPFSLWGPFEPVVSVGYIGVSFFFFLSGFILTYSHALEYEQGKGSLPRFWIARFARIYPVYLVSMLFAAWLNSAQFHNPIHILAFVADLLMLQSWSVRIVNFFHLTAWSLSVEMFFYLVFPFLLLRLRPSTATKAILAIGAFWTLAMAVPLIHLYLYPQAAWYKDAPLNSPGLVHVFRVERLPPLALPEFLAGVSLGWLFLRFRPKPRTAALLAFTGIFAFVIALFQSQHLPSVMLHNGLLIPIFALIILGLAEPHWLSRLLSASPLVLLGEASYALYLIHTLFNDWANSHFGATHSIGAALWKLAFIIPASIALHLFVERPGRKAILKWWSRRPKAQIAVH